MEIKLQLPFPPSINALWRSKTGKSGKPIVYKSKDYRKWEKAAGEELNTQHPPSGRVTHGNPNH